MSDLDSGEWFRLRADRSTFAEPFEERNSLVAASSSDDTRLRHRTSEYLLDSQFVFG